MNLLLAFGGPLTAIPLVLFAFGARRIPYSTVGLLQYIGPTIQLLLGDFRLPRAVHPRARHRVRAHLDGAGDLCPRWRRARSQESHA